MAQKSATKKTAKKTPAKKTAAASSKKPVRAVAKKAPAKTTKTTVRRTKAKKPLHQAKSFKMAKSDQKFFSLKPSVQTVYWAVFALAILALGLWVLNLNLELQQVYNEIEQTRAK